MMYKCGNVANNIYMNIIGNIKTKHIIVDISMINNNIIMQ
jgi:hypothetical protein